MERLLIQDFLELNKMIPVLDIRSPIEYHVGHIPGAVSFPLFSSDERAEVGTIYKNKGREAAIKRGLDIVTPMLGAFIEHAETLKTGTLALYCARGGMRSESMGWHLNEHGYNVLILEGGYKAYRNEILRFFEQKLPIHVLTGNTGSKKTEVLLAMRALGEQVVDLEGLANHQGSSFGKYKEGDQPSTEQFQNLIYDTCYRFVLSRPIWIEDECMRIGQVSLIHPLFKQMSVSPHFVLEVDKAARLKFLTEEYGKLSKEQLIISTQSIRKKLGFNHADDAVKLIEQGELSKAAEIILTYYDKRYQQSVENKSEFIKYRLKTDNLDDVSCIAKELMNKVNHGV